eukprot:1773526-Prymnesium_polylepis.1
MGEPPPSSIPVAPPSSIPVDTAEQVDVAQACLVSGRHASVYIYMCTARNGCNRRNRTETGEPAGGLGWLAACLPSIRSRTNILSSVPLGRFLVPW